MAEAVESVRDTLNAAFEAAEKVAPPPPRPVSRETRPALSNGSGNYEAKPESGQNAPETSESPPESTELSPDSDTGRPENAADRPRDQFGRFTRTTPEGPPDKAPSVEASEPEIPDQPEPETAEPAAPAILPPQSWSAAARETWKQLPRAIQEEVDRRERDFQRHFQQRAEQVNVLEPIAEAVRPYAQKLALRGMNPAQAVGQLLAVQDILESDPIRGVAYVAQTYGVDLRQFANAYAQAQQPQDPALRELSERVARQDQMLRQWQQAAEAQEQTRINDEVQRFAADTKTYPYFEHVRQRMAELMATGGATSLAQAYRLACADNEQVATAIAEQSRAAERSARATQERQAAERARRAAVSVSGTPYGGSPAAPSGKNQSVRDAVLSAMEQVASR